MSIPRFIVIAAVAGCLAGCDKPSNAVSNEKKAPSEGDGIKAGAAGPVQVTTKSGVEMVSLPGGEFAMGNDRGNPDETPAHKVAVSAFLMDKYEVTHDQFAKAQLPNPSHWQDSPKKPVEKVRWRDAKRYCNERSLLEGLKPCYDEKALDSSCDYAANGYRLPTEAEWEYACHAGTEGPFDFGRADKLRQYAWTAENSEQKTHPVGQKKPNGFGIHDLHGNVAEWCEDVYSPTYYKESPAVDPQGPPNPGKSAQRVIRGGSWRSSPAQCQATSRQGERTGDADACFSTDFCGFRCVRRASPEEIKAMLAAKQPQ